MQRSAAPLIIILALTLAVAHEAAFPRHGAVADTHARVASGFLDKTVTVDGHQRRYALYVPDGYTPEKEWPLIVFLHGSGERGDDNLRQTEVGIGKAIRLHRDRFPALVLMPQCPEDQFWDVAVPTIEAAIDQTAADYTVDDRAITLTGISLGGYATWIWGAMKTDTFAALMPICGGGDPADLEGIPLGGRALYGTLEDRVTKLADIPVWAFHGADDDLVPPSRSEDMVKRIKKAGGNVRYKKFDNTGHNSWDKAYGSEKAIKWLLKQRKK